MASRGCPPAWGACIETSVEEKVSGVKGVAPPRGGHVLKQKLPDNCVQLMRLPPRVGGMY